MQSPMRAFSSSVPVSSRKSPRRLPPVCMPHVCSARNPPAQRPSPSAFPPTCTPAPTTSPHSRLPPHIAARHSTKIARLSRVGNVRGLENAVRAARKAGMVLNAVNYTAVMHGHALAGDVDGVWRTVVEMRGAGVAPTNATVSVATRALVGRVDEQCAVLEWFAREGGEDGHVITWNIALQKIAQGEEEGGGGGQGLWTVFWMMARGCRESGGERRGGTGKAGTERQRNRSRGRSGEKQGRSGGRRRVPAPDTYTFNIVLSAWRRRRNFEAAASTIAFMRTSGLAMPDVVTYNVLLGICLDEVACVESDLRTTGLRMVKFIMALPERLRLDGVSELDQVSLTLLLQAVTCLHRPVFSGMRKSQLQLKSMQRMEVLFHGDGGNGPEGQAHSAERGGGEKVENRDATVRPPWRPGNQGAVDFEQYVPFDSEASRLIRHIGDRLIATQKPDRKTYNMLISAYGRVGDIRSAIRALREMTHKKRIDMDLRTYNALISAASRAGNIKLALSVLERVKAHKTFRPDAFSYSAAISACGGDVASALCLLEDALSLGVKCTPPMLNAALVCHGADADGALKQWRLWLVEDQFQAAASDVQVYRALLRVAGAAGRPDMALRILLAGKKRREIEPAVVKGLFRAFTKGLREGGKLQEVRSSFLSRQYLNHVRLECRAFTETADFPNVRVKW